MLTPNTILVVEDDAEMNELLRELLAVHGLESVPAYSGTEALDVVDEDDVGGILMDIMLPEMDGLEACRAIREKLDGRRVPILILTALDTEDVRQKGFDSGADAFFVKPFDPDQVIQSLNVLMNGGDETESDE